MAEDEKIRTLVKKAMSNIEFRNQFLKDPSTVGKSFGLSFTSAQIARIRRTAEFIEHVSELSLPHIPIPQGYWADYYLNQWELGEMYKVIIKRRFGPIGYPLPLDLRNIVYWPIW